jgi:uroporphyrinogen-III synthase
MPTLIITRPEEDAKSLAATLSKQGFDCIIDPMLTIRPLHNNQSALEQALNKEPQAILIASRHAIRTLAQMTDERHIPVIAVGQATADCAKSLAFNVVHMAGSASQALVAYALKHCAPERGALLYARGVEVTSDIAVALAQGSFAVDSVILYEAKPATHFTAEVIRFIETGTANGAVFFSQHTASTYVKLVESTGLTERHMRLRAICMSEAIAEKLRSLPWQMVKVAARPDLQNTIQATIDAFRTSKM